MNSLITIKYVWQINDWRWRENDDSEWWRQCVTAAVHTLYCCQKQQDTRPSVLSWALSFISAKKKDTYRYIYCPFFTHVQSITVWPLTSSPKHQNVLSIWWNPFCSYWFLAPNGIWMSSFCDLQLCLLSRRHRRAPNQTSSPSTYTFSFILLYLNTITIPSANIVAQGDFWQASSVSPSSIKQTSKSWSLVQSHFSPTPASYTANFHHTLRITSESWIFILVQEIKFFFIRPGTDFFIHKMQIVGLQCQLQICDRGRFCVSDFEKTNSPPLSSGDISCAFFRSTWNMTQYRGKKVKWIFDDEDATLQTWTHTHGTVTLISRLLQIFHSDL